MMRAVFAAGVGTVEVRDVPVPHAAHGQVRIKVVGVGLNYADLRIIGGDYGPNDGAGIGLELAGVVDEIGDGVDHLALGTPVAAVYLPLGTPTGSAAEYVVVPAAHAARVPSGLDLLDAATVTMNALTAAQLLALVPKGRLLVTGAAGGVGGYMVALAARAGWEVTALARATDTEFLIRAGAARVITSLDAETGFDAVLDTALLNETAMKSVRDHGTYIGVHPGKEPRSERGIVIRSSAVVPDGAAAEDMLALAAQGVLEVRRAGTVSFDNVALAYAALVKGGQRGRWVVTP